MEPDVRGGLLKAPGKHAEPPLGVMHVGPRRPGGREREQLLKSLLRALARPASFAATAARAIAAAFDAEEAELVGAEGGVPRPPLARHRKDGTPPSGPPALGEREAARALASPRALRLPSKAGAAYAARAVCDGAPLPSGLVALRLGPEAPELAPDEEGLLERAAELVAVGIEAARACPLPALARALRAPGGPPAFDAAAEAVRSALGAARCLVLALPADGPVPPPLGSAPPGGPAWQPADQTSPLPPPPLSEPAQDAAELREGRPVRLPATDKAPALLAVPVAAREGRPAGALVALGAPGQAEWAPDEAELAAACAWSLYPALAPAPCSPRADAERRNAALQDQRQDLVMRLVGEMNACRGVQAVFDCCAELLCGIFKASRTFLFDYSRTPRGVPRTKYAVPGSPYADQPMDMTDDQLDAAQALCDGAENAVFVRNGLECLPPEFRAYTTAISCMAAVSWYESAPVCMLCVEKTDGVAHWTAEDGRFMRLVADQFGQALAQSRLRERIAAQNAELQRECRDSGLLAGIVREISQELDGSIDRVFLRSAELIGRAFKVERCSLWQYFDDTFREPIAAAQVVWTAHPGIPRQGFGFGETGTRFLFQQMDASPDGVCALSDIAGTCRAAFPGNPDIEERMKNFQVKSSMLVRAVFRGKIQGIIAIGMTEGTAEWGPSERRLLRQVAEHVAVAIAHGRLLEQQRAHAAELEKQLVHSGLLEAMITQIHQVLGVREVLERSAGLVREAFRASRVRLWHVDDLALETVFVDPGLPPDQATSMPMPDICRLLGITPEEPFGPCLGRVLASGRRVLAVRDTNDAEEMAAAGLDDAGVAAIMRFHRYRSTMLGFTSFQGRVNGIIIVSHTDRTRDWEAGEVRLLQTVAEQVGVAIAQSRLLSRETEQRELLAKQNAALEEARREADAASQAKSQFLAMVSHEIRTPMNALCNMSEFLLDTELSQQQRDFCTVIHNSSLALLNILKDILDTSRLEFNKVAILRAPLLLRGLVEQVVELMFPSAAQKGIDLTWHVARECPAVLHTDGARLNQILVNMIGNGVKFTSRGEVSLTAGVHEGALVLAVRDTGIGIAPDDQRKLFSWFVQLDSGATRQYSGTGLGLFISRKLAALLGGGLSVHSAVGAGSTFRLTFPLAALAPPPDAPPPPPPVAPSPPREARPALAGRRVAVWTPSPATLALVRDALEEAGAAVAPLGRGPPPDCLVLDTHGPAPEGVPGGLPRVALAARGAAGIDDELRACAGVVLKPVKPRAALDAVAAALGALPPPAALPAPAAAPSAPLSAHSDMRILVAEDVEVNMRILLIMLRKRGYTDVASAGNGAEALAALREAAAAGRPFHCLLLDVMMPVMDGLTAARRIREEFPPPQRPHVVALTANAMAGDRERCLEAGMADYLAKPVRAEALAAALERCAAACRRPASDAA